MRKLLASLLVSAALLFSVVPAASAAPDPLLCTGYPEPRVFLESQAWWNIDGIKIPSAVGHHIHVGMCTPLDGTVLHGTVHFDVRVLLHNQVGKLTSVRVSDYSTVKRTKSVSLNTNDLPLWVPFDINFDSWSTGRHELRWTANVPDEQPNKTGSQRMYNSTGWQYCIRSCSPNVSGRATNWTEARGWYQDHGYANARFRSPVPVNALTGTWTFNYEMKPGSGGDATKLAGIYIDPDFHNGSAGRVVKQTTGATSGTASIDTRTLTNGTHKLVLLSSDGFNAGVQLITFKVAN